MADNIPSWKPQLEGKPPTQSLNRLRLSAFILVLVSALGIGLYVTNLMPPLLRVPGGIPILAGGIVTGMVMAAIAGASLQSVAAHLKRLGASRQFSFWGGHIPRLVQIRPEIKRDGKVLQEEIVRTWFPFPYTNDEPKPINPEAVKPPRPRSNPKGDWTVQWVPYDSSEKIEVQSWDGYKQFFWRKKLYGPHASVFLAIKEWVETHHPDRFSAVQAWWISHWIEPHLEVIYGPSWKEKASNEEMERIAKLHEVELIIGCYIASDIKLWQKRIGFGYEFRYIPTLQRDLRGLVEESRQVPPRPDLPKEPKYEDFFLGKGFKWDVRHTQKWANMMARDISEITTKNPDQGDPRIYGIGIRDEEMIFCPVSNINQHCGIFGTTGVGKTRYVEPIMTQVIRSGFPCIIIDPKGDQVLQDRACEECRLTGRGHQFRLFSLIHPSNDNTCTYNPLNHYNDPTHIGSRVGSVIVSAGDAFWKDTAVKTARESGVLQHWIREYLCFLDRTRVVDERGRQVTMPAPKNSTRVPMILLIMQFAAYERCDPTKAQAAVEGIIKNLDVKGWSPKTPAEQAVVQLIRDKRFSPREWNPSVTGINYWGLEATVQTLGWIIKIVGFHLFLQEDRTRAPNHHELLADDMIKDGRNSMITMWRSGTMHPIEAMIDGNDGLVAAHVKPWIAFYRHALGDIYPDERDQVRILMDTLRRYIDSWNAMCGQERKEFLNHNATLASALNRFKGKERILSNLDPDLTWSRVVDEDLVVFCGLGQLIDQDSAAGIAKMMIGDIGSYVGQIYSLTDAGVKKPKPFFLICDEISSFINEPMIDLLNKGRGAGMHIVILGQTVPDLAAILGNADKAKMVLGNLNTKIQLRAGLPEDADNYAKLGGNVKIITPNKSANLTPGVGDAGHQSIKMFQTSFGNSIQMQEVPKIPASAIVNTPKGQAFIHMMAEVYFVAQGLLPDPKVRLMDEFSLALTIGDRGLMFRSFRPGDVTEDVQESWIERYRLGRPAPKSDPEKKKAPEPEKPKPVAPGSQQGQPSDRSDGDPKSNGTHGSAATGATGGSAGSAPGSTGGSVEVTPSAMRPRPGTIQGVETLDWEGDTVQGFDREMK